MKSQQTKSKHQGQMNKKITRAQRKLEEAHNDHAERRETCAKVTTVEGESQRESTHLMLLSIQTQQIQVLKEDILCHVKVKSKINDQIEVKWVSN